MCEDENKVLRKYMAQKKWKNIPFRFPKQEECTSTDIFKKILGSCKIICSTKYLISSLHIYCYIISDHYRIFTAACTVCTSIVVYVYILKWFSTSLEICCTFLSDMPAKASGASCNFNCLASFRRCPEYRFGVAVHFRGTLDDDIYVQAVPG